jgi:nucleoside-diphosphate-sugar epimerase
MTVASQPIRSVEQLEDLLSEPSDAAARAMGRLEGDVIVLGAGGKMGPTLARMAKRAGERAGERAGVQRRVIAVSRFSNTDQQRKLQQWGVDTIRCDLLDHAQLDALPDAPNVVYMAGMKFGSTGQEPATWAMNAYLPGMVCNRFRRSRIVAFSTGNVYGLAPVNGCGSVERDALNPVGDYAMSCVGRERIFEHFSRTLNIPVSMIRLNYAVELRYGVLVDLARRVFEGETIDVSMGHMNVIWQADANAIALASFERASSPPFVLNVTGPQRLSVREVCEAFARRFGRSVDFRGIEAPDALLSNARLAHELYGRPRVGVEQMIDWIAHWIEAGGATLGKPTHFEVRDGKF